MKIYVLMDNLKEEGRSLRVEHGLSFGIEYRGKKIVLDTGASPLWMDNARELGFPYEKADYLILSHGHYDHGGGVNGFLSKIASPCNLVVGKGFFEPKYAQDGGNLLYKGAGFNREDAVNAGCPIRSIECSNEEIFPGLRILTDFPRNHQEETIPQRFVVEKDHQLVPDLFTDEIVPAFETEEGWILLVGCSHPGIMNIVDAARQQLPGILRGIIGGIHLVQAEEDRLKGTMEFLHALPLEFYGFNHCSGAQFLQRFKDKRILPAVCGSVLTF